MSQLQGFAIMDAAVASRTGGELAYAPTPTPTPTPTPAPAPAPSHSAPPARNSKRAQLSWRPKPAVKSTDGHAEPEAKYEGVATGHLTDQTQHNISPRGIIATDPANTHEHHAATRNPRRRRNKHKHESTVQVTSDQQPATVSAVGRRGIQDDTKMEEASAQAEPLRRQRRPRTRNNGRNPSTQEQPIRPPTKQTEPAEPDADTYCVVCANKLEFYAVGDCDHYTCSTCALRLRVKLGDRKCFMCKHTNELVIVARFEGQVPLYSSFGIWSDAGGPGVDVDRGSGMMYANCRDHFDLMMLMRSLHCSICKDRFTSKALLRKHASEHHQKNICNLCLENRALFTNELDLYTDSELKKHEREIGGHPLCRFCNRRWFDNDHLYRHMTDAHHTCHICPNQQRYYKDLRALENHLRSSHFVCDTCPERFVAFATSAEYRNHMLSEHNAREAITLNFQVQSGSAAEVVQDDFMDVPRVIRDAGPDLVTTVSDRMHVRDRTSSRWASQVSHAQELKQEEFPSLPEPSAHPALEDEQLKKLREDQLLKARRRREFELREQRSKLLIEAEENELKKEEALRRMAERNKRLAEAFGVAQSKSSIDYEDQLRMYEEELLRPLYTPDLLVWAQNNMSELLKIEKKMYDLISDPRSSSVGLKPMRSAARSAVHSLAAYYSLESIAYDPEPKRYVCLVKREDSSVPPVLLSKAAKEYKSQPVTHISSDRPLLVFSKLSEGMTAAELVTTIREMQPSLQVTSARVLGLHSVVCEAGSKSQALAFIKRFRVLVASGLAPNFDVQAGFDVKAAQEMETKGNEEVPRPMTDYERREWEDFLAARTTNPEAPHGSEASEPPLHQGDVVTSNPFPHSAIRGRLSARTLPIDSETQRLRANLLNRPSSDAKREGQPAPVATPSNPFLVLDDEEEDLGRRNTRPTGGEPSRSCIRECIVCFGERPVDTVLLPCGHSCMCYECASVLWARGDPCPLDRVPFERIKRGHPEDFPEMFMG